MKHPVQQKSRLSGKNLNKGMTKIKIALKKLNKGVTKSRLPRKKLKIVIKKIKVVNKRKIKKRYNNIEVVGR